MRLILTEIDLCRTCSCQEISRMETPGQAALREGATAVRGHARELEQLLTQHGCVPSQDWLSRLTIPSESRATRAPASPAVSEPVSERFPSVSDRFRARF
jgi:hypothetical protein